MVDLLSQRLQQRHITAINYWHTCTDTSKKSTRGRIKPPKTESTTLQRSLYSGAPRELVRTPSLALPSHGAGAGAEWLQHVVLKY
jgi:hypothetical protein